MKKALSFINGIIILIILYLLGSILVNNELVLPSLNSVISSFFSLLKEKETYNAFLTTFSRTLISFLISFLLAFTFSLLGLFLPSFRYIFSPIISIFKSIPTISIILILIIMVGFTLSPYIIVVLLTFPLLYEGINHGFDTFPRDLNDVLKIYSKDNFFYNLIKVRLPLALPSIISSIISSFGLGFKSSIMAEVLVGSTSLIGIGYKLSQARFNLEIADLFAWTTIITTIIILVDYLLLNLNQKTMSLLS
ncbi:TPA: ABC transporter permease subunit [bacterium]|nr:ABC transporter permease subunit [bacterium]